MELVDACEILRPKPFGILAGTGEAGPDRLDQRVVRIVPAKPVRCRRSAR
jgi:hypothetical protein